MLGRMQRKLWLICWIDGAVKCCSITPYSPDLSTCDFDSIPKMNEPLRVIRFRTVPEILQAVDRSIRTINTTGAAKGIPQLPHRWQRVVHNASDYIEGE
ncbi:hypothetical protein AVEN_261640-1 [Araneus ventricosus]|uniref:Tc1-like transposase DDE domain-containing protein n=1 Tax=Araneus ventricosus TaxID=182803 RepID=A0A4Y2V9C3_ARAVE|nr:hypothetical protein AVEN_261640-1 [Araneus ventricosus]